MHRALQQGSPHSFDYSQEYAWQEQLYGLEGRPPSQLLAAASDALAPSGGNSGGGGEVGRGAGRHNGPQWAYLKLSQPVTAPAVMILPPVSVW